MSDYIQQFHVVQTENGPRYVQEGSFQGDKVMVATGYDAANDTWPYHVYVQKPSEEPQKLPTPDAFGSDQFDAFARGFRFLQGWFAYPGR